MFFYIQNVPKISFLKQNSNKIETKQQQNQKITATKRKMLCFVLLRFRLIGPINIEYNLGIFTYHRSGHRLFLKKVKRA